MKNAVKIKIILSIILVMTFTLTSLGFTSTPVSSIKLDVNKITLKVGKTYTLKVTIAPTDATNKKLTFTSGNKNIATVDKNGKIRAVKVGNTVITVVSSSNKKILAKCNVTVSQVEENALVFKLPLTKKREVLKVGTNDLPVNDKSLKDNLPVYQELEKRTNVKINWDIDYGNNMVIRLAADTNLPDIVNVPGDAAAYGRDGVLIDLLPLINKYAPNIKKFLYGYRPDLRKRLISTDGKMYYLPGTIFGLEEGKNSNDEVNSVSLLYRKDWLAKFNLNAPATIDEFYYAMKVIKNNDPNGNGKNDEIPLGFYVTTQFPYSWYYLSGMFGLHLTGGDYYYDSNNKVINEWMLPEAKEFITTVNKWWKEELIDQGMPTMNADKWIAQVQDGITGFTTANLGHVPSWDPAVKKKDPDGELAAMTMPKGKNGKRVQLNSDYMSDAFGITKGCKNPELAIKWLDYAYFSEDGIRFQEFGIENVSYEMKEGKPVMKEQFIKDAVAKDGLTNAMYRLGASANGFMPHVYTSYGRNTAFKSIYTDSYKYLLDIGSEIIKYCVPPLPKMISTKEETDTLQAIQTNSDNFRNEMIIKFITGSEPMSNWDIFIDKLKSLDMDKILKVKQAQYDRYLKN